MIKHFDRRKYTALRSRFWFRVIGIAFSRLFKHDLELCAIHVYCSDDIDIGGVKPVDVELKGMVAGS